MEKKMENEMETGVIQGLYWGCRLSPLPFTNLEEIAEDAMKPCPFHT